MNKNQLKSLFKHKYFIETKDGFTINRDYFVVYYKLCTNSPKLPNPDELYINLHGSSCFLCNNLFICSSIKLRITYKDPIVTNTFYQKNEIYICDNCLLNNHDKFIDYFNNKVENCIKKYENELNEDR